MDEVNTSNLSNDLLNIKSLEPHLNKALVLGNFTPASLRTVLDEAKQGEPEKLLQLLAEMEIRDAHYRATLQIRKQSLSHLTHDIIMPRTASESHDYHTSEVKDLFETIDYEGLILNLTDGLAKGYSVVEIIWKTGSHFWQPETFIWRDPRLFHYNDKTRLFELKQETGTNVPLPYGKTLVHTPRMVAGEPVLGGVGLPVLWCFLFKHYAMTDWGELLEIFGHPIRIGKYPPGTGEKEKQELWRATKGIGRDFAAIMPEGMSFEIIQGMKSGGNAGFEKFLNFLDEQISKAVLGQTMTTDNGSSMAQAEVHNEIRREIMRSDAKALSQTINRDLIRPFIDVNFGRQDHYPEIVLDVKDPENTAELVDIATKVHSLGVPVGVQYIRDKTGIPEPEAGEPLLGSIDDDGDDETPEDQQDSEPDEKLKKKAKSRLGRRNAITANADKPSNLDQLLSAVNDDWEQDVIPLVDKVKALADSSENEADFMNGLANVISEHDQGDTVARLAKATAIAKGMGDVADHEV